MLLIRTCLLIRGHSLANVGRNVIQVRSKLLQPTDSQLLTRNLHFLSRGPRCRLDLIVVGNFC